MRKQLDYHPEMAHPGRSEKDDRGNWSYNYDTEQPVCLVNPPQKSKEEKI